MSIIVTDKGDYTDTDIEVVFYCNNGNIISESDAIKHGFRDGIDGKFSG